MSDRTEEVRRPPADRLLQIYLNDHLAGSVAGKELVDRCLGNNPDGPLGDFLRRLQGELVEDQTALRGVLESFGGTENLAKEAAGWLAEKLGRLKLNSKLSGYSDLSRLEELEALVLGIRGKMALWDTLEEVAATRGPLHGLDLPLLQERARWQHEETEMHRREAARRALGSV